jgi:Fe-S oxidoreductase
MGRTDLIGTASVMLSPVANKMIDVANSSSRKAMEATLAVASQRVLPPYARTRFSTWFKRRQRPFVRNRRASVALFATCNVEYMAPEIGKAAVAVYEHNGVSCSLPTGARCCGAPWLHAGDVDKFKQAAAHNVKVLAAEVRAGRQIVVPQPTCAYVIKKDYPLYLGTRAAEEVAAATYDTSEYLFNLYRSDKGAFATDFQGEVPAEIVYHAPCHLQAQNVGLKSRDLMKLTGAKVSVVAKCSGIDGTWGYRAKNYRLAKTVSNGLAKALDKRPAAQLTGDCHLANTAITEETSRRVDHPMVTMARAYGLDFS